MNHPLTLPLREKTILQEKPQQPALHTRYVQVGGGASAATAAAAAAALSHSSFSLCVEYESSIHTLLAANTVNTICRSISCR